MLDMHRRRVIRFLMVCFLFGAVVGLVGGLTLGGPSGPAAAATDQVTEKTNSRADDEATASSTTAIQPAPMTAERARTIGANEMGQILVLMYHHIDSKETEWTRTPDNFRDDIALLKSEGFYPINVRDLASGNIDIPAGKSPVVITFDDSSPGQYRVLDDGSIDPDSAVGIMEAAVKAGDWASRASFYCLLDVVPKERVLFGQPERQQEKLRNLVERGYEIGSHTVSHLNLKKASKEEAVKQLAQSQTMLADKVGDGYKVTTIAIPYGEYPSDVSILAAGSFDGTDYTYTAALALDSVPSPSPFSTKFNPMRIPRIRGSGTLIADAIKSFKEHPGTRYVSDGDPTTVSAPAELAPSLGEVAENLGRPIVRY
jgi:peptidoglycan/xylan/chitin deacetylase (PgdA/CDA1 family)